MHLTFLALLLLTSITAHATTFIERPFPEAVHEAPVIARGKIGSKRAEWVNGIDGTRRIYTYYEFTVSEAIKGTSGQSGDTLQIRTLGGEKDGMGMQISGSAQFQSGEDTVVFLSERNSDQSHDVHGMMMGKYNLQKGEDGKEYLVGPGVIPHSHDDGQSDSTSVKKWSLNDLRSLAQNNSASTNKLNLNIQKEKGIQKPTLSPSPQEAPSAPPLQSTPTEATGTPDAEPQDSSWGWLQGILIAGGLIVAAALVFRRMLR